MSILCMYVCTSSFTTSCDQSDEWGEILLASWTFVIYRKSELGKSVGVGNVAKIRDDEIFSNFGTDKRYYFFIEKIWFLKLQ